jgi:hypothetical protein
MSAQEIVRTLEASLIGEFAAAHQGSSATPIVIDAAELEPAGKRAFEDPAGAVDRLGQFSDRLSEIALAKAKLTVDWTQVMAAERQELLDELRLLWESKVTSDRDLASWADELGTRANADHVFRSAEGFPRFKEAIAFLRSIKRDKVDEWLAATDAISDPGNHAALLDAQSWSFYLRSYVASARLVLEAMRATAREISRQILSQAGGNPQELADRAADRFDAAANLLDRLGWRAS